MINEIINDDLAELLQAFADLEANGGNIRYIYKGIRNGKSIMGSRSYSAYPDATPTAVDREFLSLIYRMTFRNGVVRSAEPSTPFIISHADLARILELPLTKTTCDELYARLKRCKIKVEVTEIRENITVVNEANWILGDIKSIVAVDGRVSEGSSLSSSWTPALPLLAGMQIGTLEELGISTDDAKILLDPGSIYGEG